MDAPKDQAQELTSDQPRDVETADSRTFADDSRTVADAATGASSARCPVRVPDHELLTCVGRGSYGEVWLARNVMGTYRAVKIVYRAAFEHARPFEREFNGIQKFEPISRSHDGFVDVLQIGRTPEYFYYVMELADDVITGQQIDPATYEPKTLRSQVQARRRSAVPPSGGPLDIQAQMSDGRLKPELHTSPGVPPSGGSSQALSFDECVELGLSLTAALSHLHGHGLIHRDIKPSNIIFVNGIPKLADIGLVAEQSEAKSFVGTEGFIPPEGPGTPQADIYSLGKVLYEMATGKDRHEFPALPTLFGDEADEGRLVELNAIVLKACQSSAPLRYQTCKQMRDDLLLLQSGKSVKRAQALERRLSVLTRIGVVGASVVAAAGVAVFYVNGLRLRAARAEQATARQLYVSEMIVAEKAVREGNVGRALESLRAHEPKPGLDLTGFEYRYLQRLCEGEQQFQLPAQDDAVFAVAFSPDGNFLATGSSYTRERDFAGTLKLFEAKSRKELGAFSLPNEDGIRSVAFSSDGIYLAAGLAGSGVHVWNVRTRKVVDSLFGQEGQSAVVRFRPRTTILAAAFLHEIFERNGRIKLQDVTTRQEQASLDVRAPAPAALAFSPDGNWLAYGDTLPDETPLIRLWSVDRREEISRVRFPLTGGILALDFSADAKTLACGTRSGVVGLWDLKTNLTMLGRHGNAVLSVCFSPQGKLATSAADGTIKLWENREAQLLRGHGDAVQQVVFSPDGTQLASASHDKTVRLWSPQPRDEDVLRGHTREVTALAFSPGADRLLASASLDRTVRVWDFRSGRLLKVLADFTKELYAVAISPDGRYLAGGGDECRIRVFDTATWQEVTILPTGGEKWPYGLIDLRFSADGKLLFASASVVYVIEVASWRTIKTLLSFGTADMVKLAVSPDTKLLAISGNPAVQLYRTDTLDLADSLTGLSSVAESIAFARGERLVCGTTDGLVLFWDLHRKDQPLKLGGQVGRVGSLAISPDGKTMAVADMSASVRLRNMATGKELFTLTGHQTAVNAVEFAPDGSVLASGGSDATVRLWRTKRTAPLAGIGAGK